jgi:hypothetical protein
VIRGRLAGLPLLGLLIMGCDPGVHIAWEKDFDGSIDYDCIESALRSVAPDVTRRTWAGEARGFPGGIEVTQFDYRDPAMLGHYSLQVAMIANRKTRYVHEWTKLGTEVPPEEEQQVLPLLNRANAAVARQCGLSFSGVRPKEGAG